MHSAKQMPKAVVTEENAFRRQAHVAATRIKQTLSGQATDGAKLALEWGLAAGRADQFGSLFLLLFCFLLRCQCQLKKEFLPVAGSTNDSTGTMDFSTRITLPTQIQKRHEKTHCLGTCSECSAARCCTYGWIWLIDMRRNAAFYLRTLHAKCGLNGVQRRDNGSTSNCPLGLSRLFHAASSHCQRLGIFVCGGARPKIGTYWIMIITKLNKLAESCVLLSTRKRAGKCFMLCSYPHTTHRSCYGDRDEKWWKSFNLGISLSFPCTGWDDDPDFLWCG